MRARQVGRDEVPPMLEARAFVACVMHAPTRLQLELQCLQGLRPGEAAAVRVRDVHLGGEPVLEIRGSRTEAPREYTLDGAGFEDKTVKTVYDGATDAVARVVPLFSPTVELLRPLLVRANGTPRDPDELLCATKNGTPVSSRNRSRSMKKARVRWLESLPDVERAKVPDRLLTDSYHLRHAHATALLRGNLPPREVAARLGTSERMLTDTYSSVAPRLREMDTSNADRLIRGEQNNKDL